MFQVEDMVEADSRATLLHCLLYWEKRQPHKIYLTQPLGNGKIIRYTWKEVGDQVRRMAAHLQSLKLPARSHIAIYGKNSAHWIMADLAIWMAGHVSVPLYPTLNAETAGHVLRHSEARLLFIGKLDGKSDSWSQVKEVIPAYIPCISLPLAPYCEATSWQDILRSTSPLEVVDLPEPDDLATIIYTSGSTGLPKGVMHSFTTMMQVARLMDAQFQVTRHERFLSYLPLAHAAERALVETVSLYVGFELFFAHDLQSFPDDLRRARPTLFFSVPRLWTKFHQGINERISPRYQRLLFRVPVVSRVVRKKILGELGLANVHLAMTGSAPLPASILEWYRQLGLELLEGYAMTENFGYSHVNRPGEVRVGYVGTVQPGVECKIDDNGEVLVKSPGTMLGYYKNPVMTAEDITADGFLRTGDMGEIDSKGRLRITGRVKDLFKTAKGKYVVPVPIEQKLGESPLVEVVCVGGGSLPQPVGLVMLSEDARVELTKRTEKLRIDQELRELLDNVNGGLEPHEKLTCLVVISRPWTMDNGLLTPTLKVRRQAVEAHYGAKFEAWEKLAQAVVWE